MDDHLQEMAARAQKAGLFGLFQVIKSVGTNEFIPSTSDWRAGAKELSGFLNSCVKESGATSPEAFVLGADLGAVALRNPLLLPEADLAELRKFFGFYGRAFLVRQFVDEPHPQTNLQKKSAELVTEVALFVAARFRAHGIGKPF
jgi:hypothetical protein